MIVKHMFKFGCLCAALLVVAACSEQKQAKKKKTTDDRTLIRPADTLYVVKSTKTHNVIPATGVVKPSKRVTVVSSSRGVVSEVFVEPGSEVQKGELLLTFDDRLEKKELAERMAAGKKDSKRAARLKRRKGPRSDDEKEFLEEYEWRLTEFKKLKALIATKQVVAPIAGDLSMDIVQAGQLYEASSKLMDVTVMTPVWIDFTLPVKLLGKVVEKQPVKISCDAYPGKFFMGHVKFVDKQVDTVLNVVRLRAQCNNFDKLLLPGMNVKLSVISSATKKNILIPISARFKGHGGLAVFKLVPEGNIVKGKQCFTAVKVKAKFGQKVEKDKIEVLSGVEEGDYIISEAFLDYSGRRVLCPVPEESKVKVEDKGPTSVATEGETDEVVKPEPAAKKPAVIIKDNVVKPQPKKAETKPVEKVEEAEVDKKPIDKILKPMRDEMGDIPFIDTDDSDDKIVTPL